MTNKTIFEVTAAGFDGTTDATDGLVFLVSAPSAAAVEGAIKGTGATLCGEVTSWDESDINFHLPADAVLLAGALKGEPQDEKTVTVVFEAYGTSDFGGPAPRYAAVAVNFGFLSKLESLVEVCKRHSLSEARIVSSPQWGPGDIEEELRFQCGELIIFPGGSVLFTDYPKFGDYDIKSRTTDLATITKAYEAASHGDVVYLSEDLGLREMYEEDHNSEEEESVAQG